MSVDPMTRQYIEGAIQWAIAKIGSHQYPFLCYAFLEDAYELGNRIVLDGKGSTAREAAEAYGYQPGDPPRGSYVFFDCIEPIKGEMQNWGHMGLSLGDGQLIHSWQVVRIDSLEAIENLDGGPDWTSPKYLGWAPAEQILVGMTFAE